MKKVKRLAILAIASVAVSAAVFTSCKKEKAEFATFHVQSHEALKQELISRYGQEQIINQAFAEEGF